MRSADGPMSVPRRLAPRSIGTPMMRMVLSGVKLMAAGGVSKFRTFPDFTPNGRVCRENLFQLIIDLRGYS
jgi:hypothetical protein